MSRTLTVAAVQMNCRLADVATNTERALAALETVRGAQIVCYPELFTTGYHLERLAGRWATLAEPIPGPTTEVFARAAREHGVAILGTIVERKGDRLFDTTFVLDSSGALVGTYRKTHLHPTERGCFAPGERLEVFRVDGRPVGVAICFEHAFPPIASTLALAGAKVIFNPTAIPVGYEYLIEVRNRARAQDNQVFFVAANHVGPEGDRYYCGLSQIIDPRGRVLAQAERTEGAIHAELDLALIERERAREPALRHFRSRLYRWKEGHPAENSGDLDESDKTR